VQKSSADYAAGAATAPKYEIWLDGMDEFVVSYTLELEPFGGQADYSRESGRGYSVET
jgi:hypothetical protein